MTPPRFGPSDLDRVKALDTPSVAKMLRLAPATHEKNKFACVRCSSSDALSIGTKTPGAHCFSCSTSFSNIDLVMSALGIDLSGAVRALCAHFGITPAAAHSGAYTPTVPRRANRPPVHAHEARPPITATEKAHQQLQELRAEGCIPAPASAIYAEFVRDLTLGPIARTYLSARALDPDQAYADGLIFSIESARARAAVSTRLRESFLDAELVVAGLARLPYGADVPILLIAYWCDGAVVTVRARALDGRTKGKYQSLRGMSCDRPFNADALTSKGAETLEVTEGELDALVFMQRGRRAIGIPGTDPNDILVSYVTAYVRRFQRVTLWVDGDAAGDRASRAWCRRWMDAYGEPWLKAHASYVECGDGSDVTNLAIAGNLP